MLAVRDWYVMGNLMWFVAIEDPDDDLPLLHRCGHGLFIPCTPYPITPVPSQTSCLADAQPLLLSVGFAKRALGPGCQDDKKARQT